MSDQERDSLVSSIEQLQQHQKVLAKHITGMKRRLDDLSEQFKNRPELQQITSLQDALAQVHRQIDEPEAPVDESQQQPIQVQPYNYHLVFDRSGSRAVLMEALEKAQERLIIVSPWLNRNSIDADLLQKFRDCLNRNCRMDIGWGHLSDRRRLGKGWRYDALKDLRQLEQDYPDYFRLKLLGTHEKFLVCDSTFAMLGSHNLLTSSAQSAEREAGLRTTDPHIIQGLINRFDGADVQDAQAIDESLIAGSMSLDDGETDQDIDDSAEDDQGDAEEFLRRYNEQKRDFTGINLTKLDLTSKNLSGANFIQANLSGANLTNANLHSAKLLHANLSAANLRQADLRQADLTAASLSKANLIQANLHYANLTAADLSKAKLTKATLYSTILSGANLTGVDLVGVNIQNVNLSGADLSGANLCGANLSQNLNLSGVNLTSADLRGANLENANLEKANLKEANLSGANLNGANLSGAIMPDGTTHD